MNEATRLRLNTINSIIGDAPPLGKLPLFPHCQRSRSAHKGRPAKSRIGAQVVARSAVAPQLERGNAKARRVESLVAGGRNHLAEANPRK